MLIFCAFIQMYVFTTNHHLKRYFCNNWVTCIKVIGINQHEPSAISSSNLMAVTHTLIFKLI